MNLPALRSESQPASPTAALNDVHMYRDRLRYAIEGQQKFPSEQGARYLQKMKDKYDGAVQQVRGMFQIVQGGIND